MSPPLRSLLAESTHLLGRSFKMAILVALFALAVTLASWFFASGLPLLAMLIYGE